MVSAAAAGDLKPFAAGSWAGIRSERPGKALIVHFWGLTCAPCRTELPQWGELHEAFPDARLVFIHAERPPRKWEDIPEFLKKSGLETAENWYFADRFVDPLRYEIDPEWRGEMPMTILIDRDGASRTIVGSADLDEVRRWLEAEERKAGP
jgi:thiol-disulfide isomerase/thioredoxin